MTDCLAINATHAISLFEPAIAIPSDGVTTVEELTMPFQPCASSARRRKRIILQVEALEGRCLPSTSAPGDVGYLKVDLVEQIDPSMANETQAVLGGAVLSSNSTASAAASPYQITLRYTDNSVTDSQKAIFAQAAARWSQVIVADVPDAYVPGIGLVDDLEIDISAPSIDGVYGILGQAGPTYIRSSSSLPIAGEIQIDNADMAWMESAGQLYTVALHEMGHILGFGTIWQREGLLSGAGGSDPRFIGSRATAEYRAMFNTTETSVPVENQGGSGTADSHWRESVFGNELMTGYLNSGANPLSRVTIAALADMGYSVDMNAADPGPGSNQAVFNFTSADESVQADVNVAINSNAGVMAHYADANNYYLGRLSRSSNGSTTAEIWLRQGGNMYLLSSAAVGTSVGTLRFEVYGPSLKLFLNNTLVTYAFDSQLGAGKVGYNGSQGTTFANFSAGAITRTTLSLGIADPFDQAQAAPGSQLSRSWQDQVGNFSVTASGTAVGQAGLNVAVLNNINVADVGVEADVNANLGTAGLVARYGVSGGDTNMYFAAIFRSGAGYMANMWRNANGVWTQISANLAVTGTGQGTMRFEVIGSSLKLFWKPTGQSSFTLVGYANDTALTTGTVGLRTTAGVSVDNFTANTITSTTYTLGSTEDFSVSSGLGNQLSRNWRDQVGDFTIQNGAAVGQAGLNVAVVNGVNQADVSVEADVNANLGVAGLVARYGASGGDTNMYFAAIFRSGASYMANIWRNVNGVWTQISANVAVAGTGQGTMHFEVIGSSLKLFWKPTGQSSFTLVGSANDTALTTGTVGLRTTAGVSVDNFTASMIVSTTYTLGSTEDFSVSSGYGNQLNRSWRDQVGDFTIQNGVAVGQAGLNVAVVNGVNQADVSVEADVNANLGVAGLVARYGISGGDTNMYFAAIFRSGAGYMANLWRNVNGVWTQIAASVAVGGTGQGTMRFEVIGSSLKLYWKPAGQSSFTLVGSATDTSLTTGTVGIRTTAGASVDNFKAS